MRRSFGLGGGLKELSKMAMAWAQPSANELARRRNAAARAAVQRNSAARAAARAPSPPKPKARAPSPPKPKARAPSPPKPKARTQTPGRFRAPNRSALAAWELLNTVNKRNKERMPYVAPTRFVQNLMNEEARLIARHYLPYNKNLAKNRQLRNANLRRVREIQQIIGSLYTRSRSPTRQRRNPFVTKSPRSQRRSPARGRSLSAIRETQ
jgi:hypothetical protein